MCRALEFARGCDAKETNPRPRSHVFLLRCLCVIRCSEQLHDFFHLESVLGLHIGPINVRIPLAQGLRCEHGILHTVFVSTAMSAARSGLSMVHDGRVMQFQLSLLRTACHSSSVRGRAAVRSTSMLIWPSSQGSHRPTAPLARGMPYLLSARWSLA